jgi:hypothetical protein
LPALISEAASIGIRQKASLRDASTLTQNIAPVRGPKRKNAKKVEKPVVLSDPKKVGANQPSPPHQSPQTHQLITTPSHQLLSKHPVKTPKPPQSHHAEKV